VGDSKITGKCAILQSDIESDIYDGTDRYLVPAITIQGKWRNNDTRLARSYNLASVFPSLGTPPLTSSRFSCRIGAALELGQNLEMGSSESERYAGFKVRKTGFRARQQISFRSRSQQREANGGKEWVLDGAFA
jgi:hypothetical protein